MVERGTDQIARERRGQRGRSGFLTVVGPGGMNLVL